MKNRGIKIILIVFVLIIVSLAVYYLSNFGKASFDPNKARVDAISANNPSLCDSLPIRAGDAYWRSGCYIDVIMALGNYSLCDKYPSAGGGPDYCKILIATDKKDLSECSTLGSDFTSYCIVSVAVAARNVSMCNLLTLNTSNYWARSRCYIDFIDEAGKDGFYFFDNKEKVSICYNESIIGNARDECLFYAALQLHDWEICKNTTNKDSLDKCNFYANRSSG